MFSNIRLVIWKNCILRRRHWALTTAEIIVPLSLFVLTAYARSNIRDFERTSITSPTYYSSYDQLLLYSHFNMPLWYVPNLEVSQKVMDLVQEDFQIGSKDFRSFTSERDLMDYLNKTSQESVAIVIFHGSNPKHLEYSLTLHDPDTDWQTDKLYCKDGDDDCLGTSNYISKGFVGLQIAIDSGFIKTNAAYNYSDFSISLQRFPYPPHVKNSPFQRMYSDLISIVTILGFIFIYPMVLYQIIDERATGIKEFMKMSGLKSSTIWFGWILHALSTNSFTLLSMVVLFKVPLGAGHAVFEYSNAIILIVFLFLYFIASLSFCLFISTLFNGQRIGMSVGVVLGILSYFLPKQIIESPELHTHKALKVFFRFFPNMSLHCGYSLIASYENKGLGFQWDNFLQSDLGNDACMGEILLTLIISTIFYLLAVIWVDSVHRLFPINKFLWRRKWQSWGSEYVLLDDFAAEGGIINAAITMKNVSKIYGKRIAVDGCHLRVYQNCITVLLGENGAGKSTILSIIAGLTKPTFGSIAINGKDLYEDLDEIRKDMGLCTQNNNLFNSLTVGEHMIFFGKIKGVENLESEVEEILEKFELNKKKNCLIMSLSGGMKRKLCLAIALLGRPKVLILDEPMSGMDPKSRRKTWDLLSDLSKDSTILMTTHHLEEADSHADYVGIVGSGKLKSHGTPLELKMFHGNGYTLKLVLQNENSLPPDLRRCIEDAGGKLVSLNQLEAIFSIGFQSEGLTELFLILENKSQSWGVTEMNLSIPTLNDIFLKLSRKYSTEAAEDDQADFPIGRPSPNLLGGIQAILYNRMCFTKRMWYQYTARFLVALVMFLAALFLTQTIKKLGGHQEEGKLELSLGVFHEPAVYFNSQEPILKEHYEEFVKEQNGVSFNLPNVSIAAIERGVEDIVYYKERLVAGAEFSENQEQISVNVRYSSHALQSAPVSLNLVTNTLVKFLAGEEYSITTWHSSLKSTNKIRVTELSETIVVIQWLLFVPFGMLFLISNFIIFPFAEISTNFVRIQIMAGTTIPLYWITNFLFDLVIFALKIGGFILVALLTDYSFFNLTNYQSGEYSFMCCVFILYAFSWLPFTYCFAYSTSLANSYAWFMLVGLIMGLIPTIVFIACEASNLDKLAAIVKATFIVLSPQFGLTYWCYKFSKEYVRNFNWDHMEAKKRTHLCALDPNPCCLGDDPELCHNYKSYFKDEYGNVLLTLFAGVIHLVILIAFAYKRWIKSAKHTSKNNLSAKDEQSNDVLRVSNVNKRFGSVKAVRNLNLNVKKNICYGLLGVNGAGKTTTLRMLTRDLPLDKGDIKLRGNHWISVSDRKYSEALSYCSQADTLNPHLSGREILTSVCLLRGYTLNNARRIAQMLIKQFELDQNADVPCLYYSGGNKRKLCTCMAFIGSQKLILLDEPTSGVDPVGQRKIWEYISNIKTQGSAVLLCSHSMEECEALCDELAIMKDGRVDDEGELIDLKSRHTKGYKLLTQLKSGTSDAEIEVLKSQMSKFCLLQHENKGKLLHYQTKRNCRLSYVFNRKKKIQANHSCVQNMSIANTSLEDVFCSIAEREIDHLQRSLSCVTVDSGFVQNAKCNDLIIISCVKELNPEIARLATAVNLKTLVSDIKRKSKDLEKFENGKIVWMTNTQCTTKQFLVINSFFVRHNCHHLLYFGEDFEWLESRGSVESLKPYKKERYSSNKSIEIFQHLDSSLNILSGEAGLGQSTLLKCFNSTTIYRYSSVYLNFIDHLQVIQNVVSAGHVSLEAMEEFFLVFEHDEGLRSRILQRRIIFLWDTLDEIFTLEERHTIYRFVQLIRSEGFTQWIVTRKQFEAEIEDELGTFVRRIQDFTVRQQKEYIDNRLSTKYDVERIPLVEEKIIENLELLRSQAVGTPFLLSMLTELILQDYAIHETFPLTVTKLFGGFIHGKLETWLKKKKISNVNAKKNYKEGLLRAYGLLGIKICLEKVTTFEFFHERDIYAISKLDDPLGIIHNTTFSHQTYAEYFAALLLSKDHNMNIIRDIYFDARYRNIRFFFDMLLCENCPAHQAVLCKNLASLKDSKKDILKTDSRGRSAVHLLLSWSKEEITVPEISTTSIHKSESEGNLGIVQYVFERLMKKNSTSFNRIDDLFQMDCVLYAQGYILHLAMMTGSLDVVKFIAENSPSIHYQNEEKYTALMHATCLGNLEVTKYLMLLEPVNSVDANGNSALHFAAYGKSGLDVVELLIERGANVNQQNVYGIAPLHVAVLKSGTEVVPFHLAAERESLLIAKFLVYKGAEVNLPRSDWATPLHIAVQGNYVDVVKFLLECKADVDNLDQEGSTPIMIARSRGNLEMVELLDQYEAT